MTAAYFESDGDAWRSGALATGPWDPSVLAGGPLAALLATRLESQRGGGDFQPLRLTVDLLRPAPAGRLSLAVRPRREGKRLRAIECELESGGAQCCIASAVFCRTVESAPVRFPPVPAAQVPPAEEVAELKRYGAPGFATSMEIRPVVYPTSSTLGVVWVRFAAALFPGTELSPLARAAMTADAASGFGFTTDEGVAAINCDITLYLMREPRSAWLCIQIVRRTMRQGIAVSSAVLHDVDGPFGECVSGAIAVERPIRTARQAQAAAP